MFLSFPHLRSSAQHNSLLYYDFLISPARSLASQLNSAVGFNSANNPALFKLMNRASEWREGLGDLDYSQEKIKERAYQYEQDVKNNKRQRDA